MSFVSKNPLLLAYAQQEAAGGISRSLRFNSSDSAYLSRTPASAGNRKTWTWAGWVKRGKLQLAPFFGATSAAGFFNADPQTVFSFYLDQLWAYYYDGSNAIYDKRTTAVFRDPSAWYHIVITQDTDNATAEDRIRLYVNGVRITTFVISTNPSSGAQSNINQAIPHYISCPASYFDGYMADVHMVDGQALDPTSFGEFDATTGVWNPKAYTGSYGTNGFHLEFADNSAATATTLGKDTSGNGNNWTPNNLSVTAGAGNDSLVDVPTNGAQTDTGVGGEVRGNYCTLNPLDKNTSLTPTNGNLDIAAPSTAHRAIRATLGMSSGKWYWEITLNAYNAGLIGIAKNDASLADGQYVGANASSWGVQTGYKFTNATQTAYGSSFGAGDILAVAFDADAGTLTYYINGVSQGTAFTGLTSGPYFPAVSTYYQPADSYSLNFGQRAFAYTAPSGFKALCTANLPAPLVTKPSTVMDVVLYTGTGSSLTLPYASSTPTSIAFTPDLVWIKGRSGATDHALYDAVRDVQKDLVSNSTAAETTQSTGLTAFGTNTFTIGSLAKLNTSSATYAAWCWDAGTTTDTNNTAGSITSTVSVRANATAGFSIVTYTGTGVACTVGHGLGVAPQFIIVKGRTNAYDWHCYHASLGNTKRILLNSTAAADTQNTWNNTSPTSSVFSLYAPWLSVNESGVTFVAYCFAPVVGYGNGLSYVGNGSTDGPFCYLGFLPKLILIKCSSTTGNWVLLDTEREGYNVDNDPLFPNLSNAEGTTDLLDITSNGFKIRSTNADVNASAATYIVYAWASNPFQYSRAR